MATDDISAEEKGEKSSGAPSCGENGEAPAEKSLEEQIESLKRDLQEEKDRGVRLYADFENFRRRTAKERLETFSRAAESFYADLLPVVDSFGRAVSQAGDDPFSQGVKMVHGQLAEFLKKGGVEQIEALGKTFDPKLHEAVAYQPAEGKEEGTVVYETRAGYKMGDKVIRPSSVIVSSGSPVAEKGKEE